MEEKNVFTAKTVDEALDLGLTEMGLTLGEVDTKFWKRERKNFSARLKP